MKKKIKVKRKANPEKDRKRSIKEDIKDMITLMYQTLIEDKSNILDEIHAENVREVHTALSQAFYHLYK